MPTRVMTMQVSQKGALSVYGAQRFPTTLYAGQWLWILNHADQIRQFIVEHHEELSWDGAERFIDLPTEPAA